MNLSSTVAPEIVGIPPGYDPGAIHDPSKRALPIPDTSGPSEQEQIDAYKKDKGGEPIDMQGAYNLVWNIKKIKSWVNDDSNKAMTLGNAMNGTAPEKEAKALHSKVHGGNMPLIIGGVLAAAIGLYLVAN